MNAEEINSYHKFIRAQLKNKNLKPQDADEYREIRNMLLELEDSRDLIQHVKAILSTLVNHDLSLALPAKHELQDLLSGCSDHLRLYGVSEESVTHEYTLEYTLEPEGGSIDNDPT